MKCCLEHCKRLATFQRSWDKISQNISTRLARHHIQRFSESDAAATTQNNFCAFWIGIAKHCLMCIQIFGLLSSGVNIKAASIEQEAASAVVLISRHINLKLTFGIVSCPILIFALSNFQFMPNCPNPGHLKNLISLSVPLLHLPFTCETHVLGFFFLQWNVSQFAQI